MSHQPNLTMWQYITFRLCYPWVSLDNLIQIESRIKTKDSIELMEKQEYEKYKNNHFSSTPWCKAYGWDCLFWSYQ